MRHGLQRQTLMCASVIKCDLVSGTPPRANYRGVSLSLCHCSHQCVGETPYRLILAFSDAVPRLDCDSPQQHSPTENQTLQISGCLRWSCATFFGSATHSCTCEKGLQLNKMTKFSAIRANIQHMWTYIIWTFCHCSHFSELENTINQHSWAQGWISLTAGEAEY